MNKPKILYLCLSLFLFVITIPGIPIPFRIFGQYAFASEDQEILRKLVQYVHSTADSLGKGPSAILVSREGKMILEEYSSPPGLEKPYDSVGEKSLWPILSCTKSFAAGMLLSLATDKTISLDDPIRKYLPAFEAHGGGPYDRGKVTIRHLASHTSGVALPDAKQASPPAFPDLHDIRIQTEPGAAFSYSGLGMHILEKVIESATGEDFADMMQKRLLNPLKLKNTHYLYQYDPGLEMLPFRMESKNNPAENYSRAIKGYRAHYGLYATAWDLNRYGQLWLSNGLFEDRLYFNPELKKEAWRQHAFRLFDQSYYGLLWWLFEKEGGYVMSGDGGKVNAVVPETKVVITVLRLPLNPSQSRFDFTEDKRNLVRFGRMLR